MPRNSTQSRSPRSKSISKKTQAKKVLPKTKKAQQKQVQKRSSSSSSASSQKKAPVQKKQITKKSVVPQKKSSSRAQQKQNIRKMSDRQEDDDDEEEKSNISDEDDDELSDSNIQSSEEEEEEDEEEGSEISDEQEDDDEDEENEEEESDKSIYERKKGEKAKKIESEIQKKRKQTTVEPHSVQDFIRQYYSKFSDGLNETRYVFIGGGVASGIGKGIIVSSLAVILQSSGYNVTTVKVDPYFNIDAGTMNPWEHGEVFILKDGGEVDLDLGNYERYLDKEFDKHHNITSGKVYNNIITAERKGKYQGKTVQFFPHVSNEIKDLIYKVGRRQARKHKGSGIPNIVIVELGGTVGDMESIIFYEAVRQIMLEKPAKATAFILASYVPYFPTTGEQKTKPTQNALNALRMTGVTANALVVRSTIPLDQKQLQKLALFSNLLENQVINLPDLESVNQVPSYIDEKLLPYQLLNKLELLPTRSDIGIYQDLHTHIQNVISKKTPLKVAVVGKYVGIEDAYLSIKKAIESAGIAADTPVKIFWIKSEHLEDTWENKKDKTEAWGKLKSCASIVVPGGFDLRGLQGKINTVNYARVNNVPILGICYGFQSMCIEYARNVMKEPRATTFEVSLFRAQPILPKETEEEYRKRLSENKKKQKNEVYVIEDMEDANLTELGNTMRKGAHTTLVHNKNTLAYKLYNKNKFKERYRHRFEVSLDWKDKFEKAGLIFSGLDKTGKRMEILELKNHRFFLGVQFHPEFQSRNFKPSPPFLGLIKAGLKTLDKDFKQNGHLTHDYYWHGN